MMVSTQDSALSTQRKTVVAGAVFLVIPIVFLLTGCATVYNTATGRKEISFISNPQEISLGNDIDKQIRQQYKVSGDVAMQARLKAIGESLAAVSDRQSVSYSFTVVESEDVNAFTIPGGHIYATAALMKAVRDNHELAGVIAHEIGHVAARHPIKHMEAAYGYSFLSQIAISFVRPQSQAELERLRQISRMMNTVYRLVDLGYGRNDELEADSLALRYVRKAGYDPMAIITFMEKLMKEEPNDGGWFVFIRSHPYMKDRIGAIHRQLAEKKAAQSTAGNSIRLRREPWLWSYR